MAGKIAKYSPQHHAVIFNDGLDNSPI